MKRDNLARSQLNNTLEKFKPILGISVPPKGWIRAIRNALGMSARQLANRMGVSQQRTAMIEKDEISGSLTLKTMMKVAESLNCAFVYGFVPNTSLDQTIRDQARKMAEKRLSRASQTMKLEDQALSNMENREVLSNMVDELVDSSPKTIWNDM